MPAPIRIVLTESEDRTLLKLRVATSVPQRTLVSCPYKLISIQTAT
jgi:hypothetical protein